MKFSLYPKNILFKIAELSKYIKSLFTFVFCKINKLLIEYMAKNNG